MRRNFEGTILLVQSVPDLPRWTSFRISRRNSIGLVLLFVAAPPLLYSWWNRRQPTPPNPTYDGITYGCLRLEPDAEGSGLMHWVRVDLNSPGIELYVTPLDPDAVRDGWQFRLKRTNTVVKQERLAVGINATLFSSKSRWLPWPGDLARAVETMVADHQVSHIDEHTYLLWFDDWLSPWQVTVHTPERSEGLD